MSYDEKIDITVDIVNESYLVNGINCYSDEEIIDKKKYKSYQIAKSNFRYFRMYKNTKYYFFEICENRFENKWCILFKLNFPKLLETLGIKKSNLSIDDSKQIWNFILPLLARDGMPCEVTCEIYLLYGCDDLLFLNHYL